MLGKSIPRPTSMQQTSCSIHEIDQTRVDSLKPWTAEKRMARNKEERGKQQSYSPYKPVWKESNGRERSGLQGDNRDSTISSVHSMDT